MRSGRIVFSAFDSSRLPSFRSVRVALLRYAIAPLTVIAATALSHLIDQWPVENPRSFFYVIAIAYTTWIVGAGPGSLAVVLSILTVDYYFIPPLYDIDLSSKGLLWFLSFFATCIATYFITLQRNGFEDRLRRSRDELDVRVHERTAELTATNEKLTQEINERELAEHKLQDLQHNVARMGRILTVGELTASITHEINQPLTSIVSNGDAALVWLGHNPPNIDKAGRAITDSLAAALRAADVLAHIRALIDRSPSNIEPLAVHDVIEQALVLAKPALKRRHIHIHYTPPSDACGVVGDRVQLEQLILNLLTNAADALADIETRRKTVSVRLYNGEKRSVVIEVEDNGCGMPEPEIGRIFSPFYSTKAEGIGMGLSLSRSIVRRHGGDISVISQEGSGTSFRISLPRPRAT